MISTLEPRLTAGGACLYEEGRFTQGVRMPVYEYQCNACGHAFEEWQKITDKPVRTCPSCAKDEVERLISQTAFMLKGGGWYKDLYSSGKSKDSKSSSSDGASAKSDSGGGAKSDSGGDKKAESKGSSDSGKGSSDSGKGGGGSSGSGSGGSSGSGGGGSPSSSGSKSSSSAAAG